ncbi:MAG: sialidase-1, partial [Halobacteria archaeon]|nr:sialidase-1 [Halobacteria archaeon]
LPVDIEYSFTRSVEYTPGDPNPSPRYVDMSREETRYVTIVIENDARFRVVSSSSDAKIDGTGTIEIEIKNVGTQSARDSRVTVTSADNDVRFGNFSASSESFTGMWETGETKTVRYRVRLSDSAIVRNYVVNARVTYEDENGVEKQSKTLVTSLKPLAEQTFDIELEDYTLQLGREGSISGTVTNTGVSTARDAVVKIAGASSDTIVPVNSESAVGDLAPNESAEFDFEINVTGGTTGSKRLTAFVEYYNDEGEPRRSDTQALNVEIDEYTNEFRVEPLNATFEVDESSTLELRVTNNHNQTVTDVNAVLTVEEPLTSDDNQAFVQHLEPGESQRIIFHLEVSNDAVAKTHS